MQYLCKENLSFNVQFEKGIKCRMETLELKLECDRECNVCHNFVGQI